MSEYFKKQVIGFKRKLLLEELNKCTPAEQEFFNKRVYPNGVKDNQIEDAFDLCERTNKKKLMT